MRISKKGSEGKMIEDIELVKFIYVPYEILCGRAKKGSKGRNDWGYQISKAFIWRNETNRPPLRIL